MKFTVDTDKSAFYDIMSACIASCADGGVLCMAYCKDCNAEEPQFSCEECITTWFKNNCKED